MVISGFYLFYVIFSGAEFSWLWFLFWFLAFDCKLLTDISDIG